MDSCPLLRVAIGHESRRGAAHGNARARAWLALSGWIGWRALQDMLNAIPDSNDDFGLF